MAASGDAAQQRLQKAAGDWAFVNEEATLTWTLTGKAEGEALWSILSPTLLLGYKEADNIMPAQYIKVADMEHVTLVGSTGIKVTIKSRGKLAISCPDNETRERWGSALLAALRGTNRDRAPSPKDDNPTLSERLALLRDGSSSAPSPSPPPAPMRNVSLSGGDPLTLEEIRNRELEEQARLDRVQKEMELERLRASRMREEEELRRKRWEENEVQFKERQKQLEDEDTRRLAAEEEVRKRRFAEEDARRRQLEEEEAGRQRKRAEEDEERRRRLEEEEDTRKREMEELWERRREEEEDRVRKEEEARQAELEGLRDQEERIRQEKRKLQEEVARRQHEWELEKAREEARIEEVRARCEVEDESRTSLWGEELKLTQLKRVQEESLQVEASERRVRLEDQLKSQKEAMLRQEEETLRKRQEAEEETRRWEERRREEEEWLRQRHQKRAEEREAWEREKRLAKEEEARWDELRREEKRQLEMERKMKDEQDERWKAELEEDAKRTTERKAFEEQLRREQERARMEAEVKAQAEEEERMRKKQEESHRRGEEMRRQAENETRRRAAEEAARRATVMADQLQQALNKAEALRNSQSSRRERSIDQKVPQQPLLQHKPLSMGPSAPASTLMAPSVVASSMPVLAPASAPTSAAVTSITASAAETPGLSLRMAPQHHQSRTRSPRPPPSVCESLPSVPSVPTGIQPIPTTPRSSYVPVQAPHTPRTLHTPLRSVPADISPSVPGRASPQPPSRNQPGSQIRPTFPVLPPRVLRLSVPPPFTSVSGVFHMQSERVNGWPCWGNEGRRLYATSHGYWTVVDDPLDMVKDTGVLQSSLPHYGRPPHELEWDSACDGKWKKDNRVVVTEVKEERAPPPPVQAPVPSVQEVKLEPVSRPAPIQPLSNPSISTAPPSIVSVALTQPPVPVPMPHQYLQGVAEEKKKPKQDFRDSVQLISRPVTGVAKHREEPPAEPFAPESEETMPPLPPSASEQVAYVPYSVVPARVPRSTYPLLEEMEKGGPSWGKTGVADAVPPSAPSPRVQNVMVQTVERPPSEPPSLRYEPVQQLSPGVSLGSYRPSEGHLTPRGDGQQTPVWEKQQPPPPPTLPVHQPLPGVRTPTQSFKRTLTPPVKEQCERKGSEGSEGTEFSYLSKEQPVRPPVSEDTPVRPVVETPRVSVPRTNHSQANRAVLTSYNPSFLTRTAEENRRMWEDARRMVMGGEGFKRHSVSSGAVLDRHVYLSHDLQWILWVPLSALHNAGHNSQAGCLPTRSVTKVVIGIAPEISHEPVVRYMLSRNVDPLCVYCIIGQAKVLVLEAKSPSECEKWANLWNFFLFNVLNTGHSLP